MSAVNPITAAQHYVALSNQHHLEATISLFANNAEYHSAYVGKLKGKEAINKMMSVYFAEVPDVHWKTFNYQLIEPNTARFTFEMTGTKAGTNTAISRQDIEEITFDSEGLICRVTVGAELLSNG